MRFLCTIVLFIGLKGGCFAQDPQFSQYYAAPLLLNPAMTGNTDCYRIGMNARSQWTGLPGGAFNTAAIYMDMNYPDLRSGFGVMLLHDVIGTPQMSSTELSGFYSFLASISEQLNFRFGLQGKYARRHLNYDPLIFEDQYSGIIVTQQSTDDPVSDFPTTAYGDFSTGVIAFGEDSYWLGFSAHHLNRPNQVFYKGESRLPIKFSLHGGYNFRIRSFRSKSLQQEALRIIPTFVYKAQTKFDQLDVGMYLMKFPFLIGAWYRGIPVKQFENVVNQDAVNVQIGITVDDFSFGYSYDFTISTLSIVNTMGSHEISMVYTFCADWPKQRKPPRKVRKLPCPDFKKSLKYKGSF